MPYQIPLLHSGYKTVKGSRLTADELEAVFQGLLINELLEYDYILTGIDILLLC